MEAIIPCCAGLDIHKKSISACVTRIDQRGRTRREVRTFGTMTGQLEQLRDWLAKQQVTHVAMESTGVFWKPIYNILEEGFTLLLCNARHIKAVPGRKTDVRDCEWIAQLLQHGLLKGSFVPPRAQRDLRDLTRQRAQFGDERTRHINRLHKVLEDANIKLGSVASDIVGASGREMLRAMIAGETDEMKLAELARQRLREKLPQLRLALRGKLTEHHRFMLALHLHHIEQIEAMIVLMDQRIEQLHASGRLDPPPPPSQDEQPTDDPPQEAPPIKAAQPPTFHEALQLVDMIPGINIKAGQDLLAEIGWDMNRFGSSKHLSSWGRVCPGTEESAGKRKRGAMGTGNRWLRRVLCQVAWAASHAKNSYFSAQYRRLARRRGKKRALMAVGHSILVVIYHVLSQRRTFIDLGADYFDKLDPERLRSHFVKRLEALGYKVSLESPQMI